MHKYCLNKKGKFSTKVLYLRDRTKDKMHVLYAIHQSSIFKTVYAPLNTARSDPRVQIKEEALSTNGHVF